MFSVNYWGSRKLLGLVQGHLNVSQDIWLAGDGAPSGKADAHAGISIVVPSAEIRELLLDDELKEQRDTGADVADSDPPTPTIPGSGTPAL